MLVAIILRAHTNVRVTKGLKVTENIVMMWMSVFWELLNVMKIQLVLITLALTTVHVITVSMEIKHTVKVKLKFFRKR